METSTNLVQRNENGKAITTSLLVAEKFEKRHVEVLDAIRGILRSAENSTYLSTVFLETTYVDSMNREKPMYVMNRDGFSLLVMGFTGKDALKFKLEFIEAFNAMENQLQKGIDSISKKDLALMLIESEEEKEKLQLENRQMQPKVLFADSVSCSKTLILIGELAKILNQNGINIGQNRLFEWMRKSGYLISRKGTDYNMPTQKAMELGLFEIKETIVTHTDHTTINKTPKVTGKGQIYFVNKFLSKDAA